MSTKVRHILSLSGGKDSTALAVFMKGKVPGMEYVFCDTGKELEETYEYLKRVEAYIGEPIVYLNADRGFDHWLERFGSYLPSAQARWCTRKLKIAPFEEYIGEDTVYSYIGIRADEDRSGYLSSKGNVIPMYPFKEHGLRKDDVFRLLEESGIGVPDYYQWRTRSGCFFCFFQRKSEWVGLKERHPELYEQAKNYEKTDPVTGKRFTWNQRESLEELEQPERMAQIKADTEKALANAKKKSPGKKLLHILEVLDEEEGVEDESCLICQL